MCFTLHYITSHHITSHHITSHHITSHHITSHHITSHHVTSRHITSHHITSRHITSHHVTSRHVTSRHVTLHYITSRHVTLRYFTSRYVTLRYVTLRHITLRHVTSRHVTLRYVTLRYVTLRYVTLRYVTLRTATTTATPCVRASMKASWTSCSISRMRLLDLSRTHGNTIISLLFFEICTGSQFVKESFSSWRPWSTNVSTVCVHPTLQRTAYCCLPLVVGSTCDQLADWNCLFQEHELWHLARGLSRLQARGFGILCPLL